MKILRYVLPFTLDLQTKNLRTLQAEPNRWFGCYHGKCAVAINTTGGSIHQSCLGWAKNFICCVLREHKPWHESFFLFLFFFGHISFETSLCKCGAITWLITTQKPASQPASNSHYWDPVQNTGCHLWSSRLQTDGWIQLQEPRSLSFNIKVNPHHPGQSSLLYYS